MKNDEFYVGYMPDAPKKTASVVKRVILTIGLLVVCISLVLVYFQRKFDTATFEYGINTTVEGYIFTEPVPHLVLQMGSTADGKEIIQNILLVGFGKAGAEEVIENLQKKVGKSLVGSKVKLNGFLIYGDGKALMQITEEDNEKITPEVGHPFNAEPWNSLGKISVPGELVDPKCYFGVMKPGEGKTHRACAIRCIAGGIPPVFHTYGSSDYFLLLDEASEPVNQEILAIVGDQITLSGEEVLWNDWRILKINTTLVKELSKNKKQKEVLLAFEEGMTQCKNE